MIHDRDAKRLIEVKIEYLLTTEKQPGFKLRFFFTTNESFENEVLEKTMNVRLGRTSNGHG